MPFPVDLEFIKQTEDRLGVKFPASFKLRMSKSNGGDVRTQVGGWKEHWQLPPRESQRRALERFARCFAPRHRGRKSDVPNARRSQSPRSSRQTAFMTHDGYSSSRNDDGAADPGVVDRGAFQHSPAWPKTFLARSHPDDRRPRLSGQAVLGDGAGTSIRHFLPRCLGIFRGAPLVGQHHHFWVR